MWVSEGNGRGSSCVMNPVRFLPAPPDGTRGPIGCYGPSSCYATAVWLPILGPSTFLAPKTAARGA